MQKTTLITGASGGIGLELAKRFAQDKHNLVLIARNKEKLDSIARDLTNTYSVQVHTLAYDLTDSNAAHHIYTELSKQNITIDILVNNAGFGLYGQFKDTDLKKELDMIQLNIATLVELTKLFLPHMIKQYDGKILNLASTAAFEPGPGMAIYYASKAFVLSFSEALGEELKSNGITVTALCPGPTKTGFEKEAEFTFPKLLQIMKPEEVAYIGYRALMKGKRVIIPGIRNKLLPFLIRFTPRTVVTKITGWIQKN